jgi:RHS repeat-associated protein
LQQRSWVRGVNTTYAYDNAGSMTNTSYSDGMTPGVTNVYDRLGRLSNVRWTNITGTLSYNLAGQLLSESYSGGILNGLSVTNGYDTDMRRTNLTARSSIVLNRAVYGYDAASRLQTVSDGNGNSATYSYLANSPLVGQITFASSGRTQMTTTKQYDYLNRLTTVSNAPVASAGVNFNYTYNTANQRTKNTLADGSYWIYQFDSLGQVTNGVKHFYDGTLVPGQQFGYLFDDIGNRNKTMAGGDSAGANMRQASYTVNSLNQITARDYPGINDVIGAALATNSVTVNSQTAWRKGEYFWSTINSNNTSTAGAQWENVQAVSGGNTNSGSLYVPKTPEQFSYDPDGNLTNDGRFAYVWDAENRLVAMTNNTGVGPKYGLTFAYDYQGRRIQKLVASNSVPIYTNRFLYDGWNLIVELKPDNSPIRTYVWGTDLSGTMQGAGGVGGLLVVIYGTTNCFPAFDGNGNVAALINAADGMMVANYEYAAFGEPIRMNGSMAKNNPFRFSTKYDDDESDLLYYGYRYYKPSTGTWQNRDPIRERGGKNLYGFIADNPINRFDKLGLLWFCSNCEHEGVMQFKNSDVVLGSDSYNGAQIAALNNSAKAAWADAGFYEILEIAEGNPLGLLVPWHPELKPNELMTTYSLNMFMRVDWRVCRSATRFMFWGHTLRWSEWKDTGWTASDKNAYDSQQEADADSKRAWDLFITNISNNWSNNL